MGMYDSFLTSCPKCGKELEFQSKSGECGLNVYNEENLHISVAIGINKDVVLCQYCKSHVRLICEIPETVKCKIVLTKDKYDYNGNYNPKFPENVKNIKELSKLFKMKVKRGKN